MPASSELRAVLDSGMEPLTLTFETVRLFSSQQILLRTALEIHSLELGVLTPAQYRYVARRTEQGERLFRRHLHKLLEEIPAMLQKQPGIRAFTIPVYNRTLKKERLCAILFEELAAHPRVSASSLCLEVSADILFEDLQPLAEELERARTMGLKIALFELGDPFAPLLRLRELPCDYIFLEEGTTALLSETESPWFSGLCRFLHVQEKTAVIAPALPDGPLQSLAEQLGCDGCLIHGEIPDQEVDA